MTKPCLSARNNCSYLCLKSQNNSIKCECPTGMVVVNGVNCTAVKRDFEIYFADSYSESVNHIIKYQDQDGFTVKPLTIPSNESLDYPISLDVHLKSKYIYWTDHQTQKVRIFQYFSLPLSVSLCLSVSLSLSLCLSLCFSLSLCLSVCLSLSVFACLSVCLSACLPACLPACLSLYLSLSLSLYMYVLRDKQRANAKLVTKTM